MKTIRAILGVIIAGLLAIPVLIAAIICSIVTREKTDDFFLGVMGRILDIGISIGGGQ